jgi:hypothetical protein
LIEGEINKLESIQNGFPSLQAGRSRVRFPKKPLDFSIGLILPATTMALGMDSFSDRNEYQESSNYWVSGFCRSSRILNMC